MSRSETSIIVAGSTGEVGRNLISELLKQNEKVTKILCLVRKVQKNPAEFWDTTGENAKKIEQVVINYEDLVKAREEDEKSEIPKFFEGEFTHAFSCLGTSKKRAGSAEAFRRIDGGYNMYFADRCRDANIPYFVLCSSVGANKESSILYTKVKGEIEEHVKSLGFTYIAIFQPGILKGKQNHDRAVKSVIAKMTPAAYSSHIRTVGKAMAAVILKNPTTPGVTLYKNEDIRKVDPDSDSSNCVLM